MFIFTKEIAKKLAIFRLKNKMSQKEVAERMGMNPKSGQSYIAQLERRKIKNPFLSTILNYLDAVGVKWETFFRELSVLQSKQDHEKIMSRAASNVILSHSGRMKKNLLKKLDRDTLLYETKIKPPQNYYTKVDLNLVRQKVEEKVRKYCQGLQVRENLITHYIKFAKEILTARKFQPIIDRFTISGVSQVYLLRIMNIANKTYHNEQKKTQRQKPIRLEKARAMAEKYLQSRVKLALVESEVSRVLDQYLQRDNVYYNLYMNFARQSYKAYKTYYQKDAPLLEQKLKNITGEWLANKLKPEILEKIKEKICNTYSLKNNIIDDVYHK